MKTNTTLKSKFNSAFSLVELLVVIAVIAVIAAIAIPNITGAREAAVAAQTDMDLAQATSLLGKALAAGATTDGTPTGTAPTLEGIQAGTVYTSPEGIVFKMEAPNAP
jgi:prepilin-type N-terminal cleavage/methylation domain-containing protein